MSIRLVEIYPSHKVRVRLTKQGQDRWRTRYGEVPEGVAFLLEPAQEKVALNDDGTLMMSIGLFFAIFGENEEDADTAQFFQDGTVQFLCDAQGVSCALASPVLVRLTRRGRRVYHNTKVYGCMPADQNGWRRPTLSQLMRVFAQHTDHPVFAGGMFSLPGSASRA